ncbi:hypothetical protein CYLTODRAFT_457059 [Cylindrobasidium torrendii FP15055 ss-10]|uniref:DUF7918 domain-containing protein n=1 Tax=Cylindrobasidium torrendii FP15055 ss-10 TaxID=1314674 RepID=A0A0D7B337_9AGAR|nr:hypothetical protein CYLTODRAFT_457059 [Cylindrobasidium torrendii FP15055 ss-10]
MVRHGGITASVVVDGIELPEYAVDYDSQKNVLLCWIPSEAGKKFGIRLHIDRADYHSRTTFYADGMWLDSTIVWKHPGSSLVSCNSARTSVNTASSLLFSRNVAAENVVAQPSSQKGCIRIAHWSVKRLERLTEHQEPSIFEPPRAPSRVEDVPHITLFGKEQICPPRPLASHNIEDIERLISFVFLYRPMEYLQAVGIAPSPPPPVEEVVETAEDEDGSDDEYVDDGDAVDEESAEYTDSVEGDKLSRRSKSSKKRKASSEDGTSESETDSDSEAVDTADEDDMAEMQRLKRKIKIQEMKVGRVSIMDRFAPNISNIELVFLHLLRPPTLVDSHLLFCAFPSSS